MEKENKERKKIRDFIKVKEPVKKIRNFIKVNKPVGIVVTVLACLAVVGVSFTVYSKYYKTGFNKGMATASGFYFNSNLMASVDGLNVLSEEDVHNIPDDVLESVIISSNPTAWQGEKPLDFTVEVRNYDNQLLYNDKDLDVEYEILFMLMDKPVRADYLVQPDGSAEDPIKMQYEDEDGNRAVYRFRGTLPGGQTNEDIYKVIVDPKAGDGDYEPISVLMVAYPIGPEYLRGTKSIAGKLQAIYQEKEFSIEKANFTICEREEYLSTESLKEWAEEVIFKESGFVYQIYTSGNFSGNGLAARKRIQLIWREDMYKINHYDSYYQALLKDAEEGKINFEDRFYKANILEDEDGNIIEDENGNIIGIEANENGKWRVMEIDILPYASLKFTFFRKDGFEDAFKDAENRDVFEKSVRVRLPDENNGGGSDPGTGGDPDPTP